MDSIVVSAESALAAGFLMIPSTTMEGLYSVLFALMNPKDKILIPSPAYPAYENISVMIDAEVINYELNAYKHLYKTIIFSHQI